MTYSVAVDLGTTFVAAAVARPGGVGMATLGDGAVVAPAVVHVGPDGTVTTGDAAERRALGRPDRMARQVKRALGDARPILLGGMPHPVPVLLGAQLRDVLATVAAAEGGPPERVVLTHPAGWGLPQRRVFDEVWSAAGLEAPQLVTDAEAVVHHATSGRLPEGAVVAVLDVGGGTADATVLRRRARGVEILGTPESVAGGGHAIDEAVLAWVDRAAGGVLAGLDAADPRTAAALARLRQDCVLAKETLSHDTDAVVPVFLPDRHVEVRLTRAAFEETAWPWVMAAVEPLSRTVRSAGLNPSDLHSVLLVGGTSRIPLVAELVAQELGRAPVDSVHPKYAVALGAASMVAGSMVAATPAGPVAGEPRRGDDVPAAAAEAATVSVRQPAAGGADRVVEAPVRAAEAVSPGPGPVGGPMEAPAPARPIHVPPIAPAPGPPSRGRLAPVVLAAAVAVLLLVLVFVLFP